MFVLYSNSLEGNGKFVLSSWVFWGGGWEGDEIDCN